MKDTGIYRYNMSRQAAVIIYAVRKRAGTTFKTFPELVQHPCSRKPRWKCLDFSRALWTSRVAKTANEIPGSSARTPVDSRACILRLRERGEGTGRSIPSVAGTREKLIEKHFRAGAKKNKRAATATSAAGPRSSIYRANAKLKFDAAAEGANAGGRHGARKR